jgi:hypothetical protein
MAMSLAGWVDTVRDRLHHGKYVDFAEISGPPDGPYRARITTARVPHVTEGVDVGEREIVNGELQVLYVTRCTCGRRWVTPQFESISVCPRCGCAVRVEAPKPSTD